MGARRWWPRACPDSASRRTRRAVTTGASINGLANPTPVRLAPPRRRSTSGSLNLRDTSVLASQADRRQPPRRVRAPRRVNGGERASPLIEGKLVPSRSRGNVVVRNRLDVKLDSLAPVALTLVDAPVGFGKTMLLQSWSARTDAAVAWVSLEADDDDPMRLWRYIAASIDRIRSGLGRGALNRLRARAPGSPPEVIVDELLAGVSAYRSPLVIVLDDLHQINDDACLRSLEHAVEHLPPNARVIAATRSDPRLPLGRLRACGALGEIRARELAFTLDEARELLVEQNGIALDEADIALLVERTEGWAAGLHLAALWLRELDDPKAGAQAFHGDHRNVVDYLSREVLDTLDADTRRFLLETSVFGTFNPTMCDALLDRADSGPLLHDLERANCFLIALQGPGEWYRYHHLFGELLTLELANGKEDASPRLHLVASRWCQENGRIDEAIEHAAAAGEAQLVAGILADEHRELLGSGRLETILRWCTHLPPDVLLDHPELALAASLAAGLMGSPAHVRHRFNALAERARLGRPNDWSASHQAALGIARASWVEGDLGDTIELARETVDVAKDLSAAAVPTLANLALLLFLNGDDTEAATFAKEALARPEAPTQPNGYVIALAALSLVESDLGRPRPAEERAREALAAATRAGLDRTASGGAARVALASALGAQGRLLEAEREAVKGERLRRQPDPEGAHLHALLVLASIKVRRGLFERAAANLEQVRLGLQTFTDSGRLPELAAAIETLLDDARSTSAGFSEAPSAAELAVLPLLATDLSLREVGARLYLSLNTVKSHTRALYRKLGVTSRGDAVVRAIALGLLDQCDSPG